MLIFVRQLAQVNIDGAYGPGNPGWNMAASAVGAMFLAKRGNDFFRSTAS
jgi:hypothetical protein